MADTFKAQLRDIVSTYESMDSTYGSRIPGDIIASLQARCLAAIERVSGRQSSYLRMAAGIVKEQVTFEYQMTRLVGVVRALLADLDSDYMESIGELTRGDVFADYLDMAGHLLDKGYKDAAAVLAGSTLEVHLRKLCVKSNITTIGSNGKPKKADLLNSELHKAGAYSNLEQKSVTAWLSLRNDAAHGNYSKYVDQQVRLLVSGIRDFVARHAA